MIASTRAGHADALEEAQLAIFPTLEATERFNAAHYRRHVTLFPEGQFVALDGDRVVGATSTIRRHFDFAHANHTFDEIIQGGWLTSHEPDGDWLYGADLGVIPAYRGRGLARALYAARQELVWSLGLKGQLSAGMMSGYGARKHEMTAEAYFEGLRDGTINDPTISMQQRIGFEVRQLLPNHLHDPVCDDYSVLIVLDAGTDVPGAVRPEGARTAPISESTTAPRRG
ncbi:MAG: GNAT family N-acetyltransferase [Gemmatimonadota bacterium]|nr:GNAT family N-acetyltransferase [Gemmatimonadota bacterium]